MRDKVKNNIIRYTGIALGTIAFRYAWEFYNSTVDNKTLIVSLFVFAAISVNFIAALLNTGLENNKK